MTSREMFVQFFAEGRLNLKREEDGKYTDDRTQLAWEAWISSAGYYHLDGEG